MDKTGRGAGVGDWWIKWGAWELWGYCKKRPHVLLFQTSLLGPLMQAATWAAYHERLIN